MDTRTSLQLKGPDGKDYLKGCELVHMTLKKGVTDKACFHPKHYIYVIKGGKLNITGGPAGARKSMERELPAGAGAVMPEGEYIKKNVGDSDLEVVIMETGSAKWVGQKTPEGHLSCLEAETTHYKSVAEDEDWMVVQMDMKPGEEDKPHSHREHVVYVLTEGELSIWGGKEKTDPEKPDLGPVPVAPGAVLPVPTGFHIVKNTGTIPVTAMFFERKR